MQTLRRAPAGSARSACCRCARSRSPTRTTPARRAGRSRDRSAGRFDELAAAERRAHRLLGRLQVGDDERLLEQAVADPREKAADVHGGHSLTRSRMSATRRRARAAACEPPPWWSSPTLVVGSWRDVAPSGRSPSGRDASPWVDEPFLSWHRRVSPGAPGARTRRWPRPSCRVTSPSTPTLAPTHTLANDASVTPNARNFVAVSTLTVNVVPFIPVSVNDPVAPRAARAGGAHAVHRGDRAEHAVMVLVPGSCAPRARSTTRWSRSPSCRPPFPWRTPVTPTHTFDERRAGHALLENGGRRCRRSP